jgi:phage tail sheath protein FI
MGMIANTISKRGIAKAPAGEQDGALADAQDVSNTYSGTDRDLLYPLNVNCIENIQDVGPCVMGSRTGDFPGGDFNQLHVRNTMIYLEQSLKNGTRFVLFEPNTAATRAKVKRSTDGFLETEWRKGTLDGNVIGDAFTSVCDTSNNPAVIVKAQQMIEDVYVNIPGTIENLVINVQQNGLPPAPSSV